MNLAIISISKQGNALNKKIASFFPGADSFGLEKLNDPHLQPIKGKLGKFCGELFSCYDGLIFVMACGIAVRSIAPHITDKLNDPAVVVVDDRGLNAISLLSGHIGGANKLAEEVAQCIGAKAVITTSSDINKLPSVDMLALQHELIIDSMEDAKRITAKIVNGETVGLIDEFGLIADYAHKNASNAANIIVTNKLTLTQAFPFVKLIPRNLAVGIGCRRGTDSKRLCQSISEVCKMHNLDERSIKMIASITIKSDEQALHDAAEHFNSDLIFYTPEQLQTVEHLFEQSAFVKQTTGAANVSASAAYLAGNKNGEFVCEKHKTQGITISIFIVKHQV